MMHLLRPLRYLSKALVSETSSRQMAIGFAMGAAIGLVPKGNLTAIVLMMVLGGSRVNLAAGMLGAFLFSWVAIFIDPLSHRLGLWLLQSDNLHPLWTSLYDMPVVPWTSFNNTVVLGSLLIGVAIVYPVYRLAEPICAHFGPRLANRLRRYKAVQWLFGAEWAHTLGRS